MTYPAPLARPRCSIILSMLTAKSLVAAFLITASILSGQTHWFQPSLLDQPEMKKALASVDQRAAAIIDEWIRIVEIPAPSGKEQARASYIRTEMEKLGLSEIRMPTSCPQRHIISGAVPSHTTAFRCGVVSRCKCTARPEAWRAAVESKLGPRSFLEIGQYQA